MIMTNRDFYVFLDKLAKNDDFNECVTITDRKEDEQFKLELILRLLIAVKMDLDDASYYNDLGELLDRETIKILETIRKEDYGIIEDRFNRTFKLLNELLGEDSFKKYTDDKHKGAFLVSAFQGIASGIYINIDSIENESHDLVDKIRKFYDTDVYIESTKKGARAVPRFKELTLWGKNFFGNGY